MFKLCPSCNHSPWPFVMVLVLAGVTGFVTWLVVGLSVRDPATRIGAGALVFLAVGATMLHYVLDCLKRHCRHGKERPSALAQRVGLPRPPPARPVGPSARAAPGRSAGRVAGGPPARPRA